MDIIAKSINVEITIKADYLEEIPDHIKSKCAALVLDQLQRAYVSAPPIAREKIWSCEEKTPQSKYTHQEKIMLESVRCTAFPSNERLQDHINAS